MALAKRDYDAQAAEEAFTRLRKWMDNPPGPMVGESTGGLLAVLCYAMIAQAHAMEDIARSVASIDAFLYDKRPIPVRIDDGRIRVETGV